MKPESDGLVRPRWIIWLPAVLRGAALVDVVDRAIDTEDEPATVRKFELMWPVPATSRGGGLCGLAPAGLISHGGLLACVGIDTPCKQSAVRRAIGSAYGRVTLAR